MKAFLETKTFDVNKQKFREGSYQVGAGGAAGRHLVGAVQGAGQGAGGAVGGLTVEVGMTVLSGLQTGLAHIDHPGALGPLNAPPSRSLLWPSFISLSSLSSDNQPLYK